MVQCPKRVESFDAPRYLRYKILVKSLITLIEADFLALSVLISLEGLHIEALTTQYKEHGQSDLLNPGPLDCVGYDKFKAREINRLV
jgi:hypothetical protein